MSDFRVALEPQGESQAVYRIGAAIFAVVFAVPMLLHVLASLFA